MDVLLPTQQALYWPLDIRIQVYGINDLKIGNVCNPFQSVANPRKSFPEAFSSMSSYQYEAARGVQKGKAGVQAGRQLAIGIDSLHHLFQGVYNGVARDMHVLGWNAFRQEVFSRA